MPGIGGKGFEWGMKIFKDIMLDHEANFSIIVWVWKNPQDIHKEIYVILSVTTIKDI